MSESRHDRRKAARKAAVRGYATHSIRKLAGWRRGYHPSAAAGHVEVHSDPLPDILCMFGEVPAPLDAMPPAVHRLVKHNLTGDKPR
jgi:hypothetical protein